MLSKHQISWFIQFIQFIRFPVNPNLTRNGLNQSFLQAIQSRKVLQTCTTLDVEDDGYCYFFQSGERLENWSLAACLCCSCDTWTANKDALSAPHPQHYTTSTRQLVSSISALWLLTAFSNSVACIEQMCGIYSENLQEKVGQPFCIHLPTNDLNDFLHSLL